MTYASYDDLVTRFGETKLTQLTDRATPLARVPDRGVIEAALADATETIDGYAAGRYLTPLSPVPAPVLRWCADMAVDCRHTGTCPPPTFPAAEASNWTLRPGYSRRKASRGFEHDQRQGHKRDDHAVPFRRA